MQALLKSSVALLALLTAGCAHSVPPSVAAADACAIATTARGDDVLAMPFRVVNGRVYVEARVNGAGPYTFAIDTGASDFARADASLVSAMELSVTGAAETSDGVSTATVNTVHLDSLSLGALTRENIDVITRDYSANLSEDAKIHGILARDFFADGLLVLDFPARVVRFTRAQSIAADDPTALAYERPFRVPVTIGEIATTGNLDTGAGVALVMPTALFNEAAGGPLQQAGTGRLTNTTIETSRGIVEGPVRIGAVSLSNVEARVADRFPELMVGAHVLQNYVIAIDQRSKRVAVCTP